MQFALKNASKKGRKKMTTTSLATEYSPSTWKPLRVTEWHDPSSDAQGWLVIDRRVKGVAGGGIFMSEGATEQEAVDIAHTMSKKFLICEPVIGGAKAGIRCNSKNLGERQAVLQRFLSELRSELRDGWVTAGDFGTDDRIIQETVEKLTRHDMQWALFQLASENDDQKASQLSRRARELYQIDMSSALRDSTRSSVPIFSLPLIEAAVGYGIVQAVVVVCSKLEPWRARVEHPLEGLRFAVQGAGTVGSGVCLYASRLGAKIVTLSDAEGILYDSDGLDVEQLLATRTQELLRMNEGGSQASKILTPYVRSKRDSTRFVSSIQAAQEMQGRSSEVESKLAHMFCYSEQAHVFVPAASRYLLNSRAIEIASRKMWADCNTRIIVAGANNPIGQCSPEGVPVAPDAENLAQTIKTMQQHSVVFVPDFRANGGTAQLFHCYASGELDWVFDDAPAGIPTLDAGSQKQTLDLVGRRIVKAITEDINDCEASLVELPDRAEERVSEQLQMRK